MVSVNFHDFRLIMSESYFRSLDACYIYKIKQHLSDLTFVLHASSKYAIK